MSRDNVPGFPDLFTGTQDKSYIDYLAKDVVRIRGTNVNYFALLDTTERVDGDRPLNDKEDLDYFDVKSHSGNVPLYGEPIITGTRINSQIRETKQDWNYSAPYETRGIVEDVSTDEDPDERGTIYVRSATISFARANMDDLDLVCRRGDIVQLPKLLNGFFDVLDVSRDESRFGADGFFSTYRLSLTRSSKFLPQRKNLKESIEPTQS